MVKFDIEKAWIELNRLVKAAIYYDRKLAILYYGNISNNDDGSYYIATVDYLHLPEVADNNVITFTKPVSWDNVTMDDIETLAAGLQAKLREVDLRVFYKKITEDFIYEKPLREQYISILKERKGSV